MSFPEETIHAMHERLILWKKELPRSLQDQIPDDRLIGVARSMTDVVFGIILEFLDFQQGLEKKLFRERTELISKQRAEREELIKRFRAEASNSNHKESPATKKMLSKTHEAELAALDKEHTDVLFKYDAYIVDQFDHLVAEQQTTFKQAAVPGFFLTSTPHEIKVQTFLIKCMLRLVQEFGPRRK